MILFTLLYLTLMLGFQSGQQHHVVFEKNVEFARDEWVDRFHRYERFELAKQLDLTREQRLAIRKQQQEAYRKWKRNETSTISTNYNFTFPTEGSTSDESMADTFLNGLISFICMVIFARILLKLVFNFILDPNRIRSLQRLQRRRNNSRFQQWVQTLNRQRESQGERPLSAEALRLVLQESELSGNDYEALLEFQDEAGPAMEELLRSMGATDEEIQRCPSRTIQSESDESLVLDRSGKLPECAVCLEYYEVGETVRTLPCFHTFHAPCIDRWLAQKALCPICKHSARA